jgi:branched-chain amino acid transport system ATP-binding protein
MTILAARALTKRFGGLLAVNQLDLDVEERAIHSIIGPNGAGKTTFFNCITGFYRAEEGRITFGDVTLDGMRPDEVTRLGIARTYQNIRLFANMTCLENILVGMHPHLRATWVGAILANAATRREEAEAVTEARRILDFIGLRGKGDLLGKNLPYGEQRRLEIARALASRPKLLLLDEPTAGMNPRESLDTMAFIRRLRDELSITILLIEHNMRVVMGISELITVLDFGQKIAEGTPEHVRNDPRVIEAYLGTRRGAEGVGA